MASFPSHYVEPFVKKPEYSPGNWSDGVDNSFIKMWVLACGQSISDKSWGWNNQQVPFSCSYDLFMYMQYGLYKIKLQY